MARDMNAIKKILEAIEKAVDSETLADFTAPEPKTEESFDTVKDGGKHDMEKGKNFDKVQSQSPKKMETKPSFGKVSDKGVEGGATGVDGAGKAKEVKLEAAKRIEAAKKIREAIELLTGKKVVYAPKGK